MISQVVCLTLTHEENSRVRRQMLETWKIEFQLYLSFLGGSMLRGQPT